MEELKCVILDVACACEINGMSFTQLEREREKERERERKTGRGSVRV